MNHEDLKDAIEEMFRADPEVDTAKGLQAHLLDAGEDVEESAIEAVCDELVEEGFLQKAGRKGYEMTEDEILQNLPIGEAMLRVVR